MQSSAEKILVTGANGWLGTEYLEHKLLELGSVNVQNQVVCVGSRAGTKRLSDGTELQVHTFQSIPEPDSVIGIVHLAFLTRDKLGLMELSEYALKNTEITSSVLSLIKKARPNWVASVSSGAINAKSGSGLETDFASNPYGYLKRVEEEMLDSVCRDTASNLSVGRLWGASGLFMPINRAYALSDFIIQALETGSIHISSNHPVFRRYSKADEFLRILEKTATQHQRTLFDSGGPKVEIQELAELVAQKTKAKIRPRIMSPELASDVYFPISDQYESLARQFGVQISSLQELVSAAITSHTR